MIKFVNKVALGTTAFLLASTAFATGPDFSQLSSGVDFSSAVAAVVAIGVAVAGLRIAKAGVRSVLGMIRG